MAIELGMFSPRVRVNAKTSKDLAKQNGLPSLLKWRLCRVGLVVSVSASHTVGCGFASRPGTPKIIIKMVQTASQYRHACVRVGV